MMNDLKVVVDMILLAIKTGTKTEDEAVEECADLAKNGLIDWDYLRLKHETLHRKVEEWCRTHPPEL